MERNKVIENCPHCKGWGRTKLDPTPLDSSNRCPYCTGTGRIETSFAPHDPEEDEPNDMENLLCACGRPSVYESGECEVCGKEDEPND